MATKNLVKFGHVVFTKRCYAVYAVVMRLFVHPSVSPSQAGTVPKRLNIGSCKQCHTIAQGL